MQRWLSTFLGLAAVALAVLVVVRTMSDRPERPHPAHEDAAVDAAPAPSTKLATATAADAGKHSDAAPSPSASPKDAATPDLMGDPTADPGTANVTGAHFADGRPVPPLPAGSPKHVRVGIVLMTFAGAQGAPPTARSKKEAEELATKLASDAKSDFHGAVVRGDSGSSDDIGRVPRGVLEPATEYTVFTMPVGSISDPIETPRGFWIAKRTE